MNRVILTGLVGSEPNVINFQDGSKKVTASLATSERWTDKNTGERRERTEWHTIVFPPNNHETVLKYLTKGRRIEVEGKYVTASILIKKVRPVTILKLIARILNL